MDRIKIGELNKGKLNKITDVKGVKVGHYTIDTDENKTGVTVIIPSKKNVFTNKLIAAVHVINGFGKTTGLLQIEELGQLESYIALTNTLSVGIVQHAMVEYMIEKNKKEGVEIKSFNQVVGECNDSYLNNIQKIVITKEQVVKAINSAKVDFEEGDIGAGKGTSCFQLKGGIGSSSRVFEVDGKEYTIGVLVQSNFGLLPDLTINGKKIGKEIEAILKKEKFTNNKKLFNKKKFFNKKKLSDKEKLSDNEIKKDKNNKLIYKNNKNNSRNNDLLYKINFNKNNEKGSIIIVVATDLPLTSRQLKRILKRVSNGLARLGSITGHGSGEIVIGFSTTNILKYGSDNTMNNDIFSIKIVKEEKLNFAFRAVTEATEEAVLKSMLFANDVIGYNGNKRVSLKNFIRLI